MADSILLRDDYAAKTNHVLQLFVRRDDVDAANNRSAYAWEVRAIRLSGATTFLLDPQAGSVLIAGATIPFSHNLDFRSTDSIILANGLTGWVTHAPDGTLSLQVGATHNAATPFGVASIPPTWFETDPLSGKPGTAGQPTFSLVTGTSFRVTTVAPPANGSPITTYRYQWATNNLFTTGFGTSTDTDRITDVTGLIPGTKYWVRVRAENANGVGPWSTVATQSTLPSVPPGINVYPSASGDSATLWMTPPGGGTGVISYTVQRRLLGGVADFGSIAVNPYRVNGLIPGAIYEWRARANYGVGVNSPYSNWLAVAQPNPNVNPGDYYDGATAPRPDAVFSWIGTAHNSKSQATGQLPWGWMTFADGNNDSGGSGAVHQITGNLASAGEKCARVQFTRDTTAAGFISGNSRAGGFAVEANSAYMASIYVRLDRPQRMQPGVALHDLIGNFLTYVWGEEVLVPADEDFRLNVLATTSVVGRARPVVRDVVGTGHSLWLGGESYLMDASMASLGVLHGYFDGSWSELALDPPEWDSEWEGTPQASPSVQIPVTNPYVGVLIDPDCPPLPEPPSPPTVPADCIDDVTGWNRYIQFVPASNIRKWRATLPTFTLATGAAAERQVRIRTYPNPDGLEPDQVDTSWWESEVILSYIPPYTQITLDSVTQRAWAILPGGHEVPAGELMYGTNGAPATWPEFTCGDGYLVSFDVPIEAPPGNLETGVTLTARH